MTTGKRALIVDDSRSARVILSRMLEQHGLAVDTAESAEQALEYLGHHRPDVIFMDHLMPGMDGFQAVRTIKNEPQTASIPLMMYTSQEGELYVSQARALGAVGVLPKTVRPVDVSRVLYQLHLLPDRRQNRSALFEARAQAAAQDHAAAQAPALAVSASEASTAALGRAAESAGERRLPPAVSEIPAAALAELQGNLRQSTQQVMKDQFAEQRRFVLATFEAFARRVGGDLREAVTKAPPPPVVEPPPPAPPPRLPHWPVVVTALLAALPAAVLGFLYLKSVETNAGLARELAEVRSKSAADAARLETLERVVARTRPQTTSSDAATDGAPWPRSGVMLEGRSGDARQSASPPPAGPLAVEYVPYGETPLANARLDRLRGLAATLEAQHFRGRIVVESFVGDFCLSGSAGEGYALAEPALAAQKCDVVGNPFEDGLSPAQRQSVDFANFAASLRKRTGGAIVVEPVSGGRRGPADLPEQREGGTAGQWNATAAQQNRVEFRLAPAA